MVIFLLISNIYPSIIHTFKNMNYNKKQFEFKRQIIFLDSNKENSNKNQKYNESNPFDNAKIPENNPSVFDDDLAF